MIDNRSYTAFLPAPFCGVTGGVDRAQGFHAHLGVDGGGFHRGVAEKLLDVAYACPAVEQVLGAGVTDDVRETLLLDTSAFWCTISLTMSTVLETADEVRERLGQDAFNMALWKRLLADPTLARLPYRIETDEHGQMIMSPPPAPSHGSKQSEIARRLGNWNPGGKVLTECPISTRRGVKVADVAWCSLAIWEETQQEICFLKSPEICVEVLSPSNTRTEIEEKKRLYFEAGAEEVWLCSKDGSMQYFVRDDPEANRETSRRCPDFPSHIG